MKNTQLVDLLGRLISEMKRNGDVSYETFINQYDHLSGTYKVLEDGSVLVPLTQGKVAIIDAADLDLVRSHKWFACRDKSKVDCWYARAKIKGKSVPLHRHIFGVTSGDPTIVDHKDCNTLNCRRGNLRGVTVAQSMQNRRSWTSKKCLSGVSSNFKGVYFDASQPKKNATKRWRSVIKANKKTYHLGRFETAEAAARAYDAKAKEVHGEYARLNFPD